MTNQEQEFTTLFKVSKYPDWDDLSRFVYYGEPEKLSAYRKFEAKQCN